MGITRRGKARSYKYEAFGLNSKCVLGQVRRDRWETPDGGASSLQSEKNLKQRAGESFLTLTSKTVRSFVSGVDSCPRKVDIQAWNQADLVCF